jgi:hypothetical protein
MRQRELLAVAEAERKPVRQRNRLREAVGLAAAAVAAQPELHPAIVELCSDHHDLHDRVAAALVREHWDPAGAAATLLAVAEASGQRLRRPVSMRAALEVSSPAEARIAALCLMNIDAGRGNVSGKPAAANITPPVASNLELDAAQRVVDLQHNGGLEHAYHVAGPDFRPAASALQALGAEDLAATLHAFVKMCGDPPPESSDEREARLRRTSTRESSILSKRFDQGASRVQQLLDDAQPR